MFDITLITITSIATVGIMELIKVFLSEEVNAKVKAGISIALSIAFTFGFGFLLNFGTRVIILSTIGTVGIVQGSYNFLLKLLKAKIEEIKSRVKEATIQTPYLEKQIEKEMEKLIDGASEEKCDCEDHKKE